MTWQRTAVILDKHGAPRDTMYDAIEVMLDMFPAKKAPTEVNDLKQQCIKIDEARKVGLWKPMVSLPMVRQGEPKW